MSADINIYFSMDSIIVMISCCGWALLLTNHRFRESKEDYATLVEKARALEEQEAEDLRRAIEFSKQEMERLNAEAEKEKQMLEEVKKTYHKCFTLSYLFIGKLSSQF